MDRRRFLRWLLLNGAAALGGGLLAGCGDREIGIPGWGQPLGLPGGGGTATPTREAWPAEKIPPPPAPPERSVHPDLVVARGPDPPRNVRAALDELGGIGRFVTAGDWVIIKPNIGVGHRGWEMAATTNPWVVGALVKLCLEARASRVQVLDFPYSGTPAQAFSHSGIEEQVLAAGGEMLLPSAELFESFPVYYGQDLREVELLKPVWMADVLINVPVAKQHPLSRLSLGIKNLMGVIRDRPALHDNLGQRLADLATQVRPTLTVVDATRVLRAHGPVGANLDDVMELNTIIASEDIVAADSFAASLFGLRPEEVPAIKAAARMGVGRSELGALRIQEVSSGS
jgi:uncharacterized protein (DUF362 family)